MRQQIAALRTELRGLQAAQDNGPYEERAGEYLSAQAFRGSILRAEFAQKQSKLKALLDRADDLHLNPAEDRQALPSGSTRAAKALAEYKSRARKHFKALAAVAILVMAMLAAVTREFDVGRLSNAATVPISNTIVELAPAINALAEEQGKMFFTREIKLDYAGGPVILSGAPVGPFSIDDAMTVSVIRPDGSSSRWAHTFNTDCYSNSFVDAQDLTWMFLPGVNTVRVELSDVCGATWGTSGAIILTNAPL